MKNQFKRWAVVIATTAFAVSLGATASYTEPDPRPTWEEEREADGWVYWGEADGHHGCYALIGDTSFIDCPDGYRTTS
jgi:hypothetical protein